MQSNIFKLLRDRFLTSPSVPNLTSFSTTFDTKNGKMDQVERAVSNRIVNTIRREINYSLFIAKGFRNRYNIIEKSINVI